MPDDTPPPAMTWVCPACRSRVLAHHEYCGKCGSGAPVRSKRRTRAQIAADSAAILKLRNGTEMSPAQIAAAVGVSRDQVVRDITRARRAGTTVRHGGSKITTTDLRCDAVQLWNTQSVTLSQIADMLHLSSRGAAGRLLTEARLAGMDVWSPGPEVWTERTMRALGQRYPWIAERRAVNP